MTKLRRRIKTLGRGPETDGGNSAQTEREREGGVIIVQVFKKNSFGLKILKLEFTHCGH